MVLGRLLGWLFFPLIPVVNKTLLNLEKTFFEGWVNHCFLKVLNYLLLDGGGHLWKGFFVALVFFQGWPQRYLWVLEGTWKLRVADVAEWTSKQDMFFECLSVMKPAKGNMISHCKDHLIHQTRIMSFVLVLEYGGHYGLKLEYLFSRRCLFSKQHISSWTIFDSSLHRQSWTWNLNDDFPTHLLCLGSFSCQDLRRVCFRGIQTTEMGFFTKKKIQFPRGRSGDPVSLLVCWKCMPFFLDTDPILNRFPQFKAPQKNLNQFFILKKSPERNTKNPTR